LVVGGILAALVNWNVAIAAAEVALTSLIKKEPRLPMDSNIDPKKCDDNSLHNKYTKNKNCDIKWFRKWLQWVW
jgi:hypothetical protein